jgi:hypothetical protein
MCILFKDTYFVCVVCVFGAYLMFFFKKKIKFFISMFLIYFFFLIYFNNDSIRDILFTKFLYY